MSTHQWPRPDVGQIGQGEPRAAFLARQVAEAERPTSARTRRAVGQHQQVIAVRVGLRDGWRFGPPLLVGVGFRSGDTLGVGRPTDEGDLGAEHRRQADRPGRLGEADHAVQSVVIGERERLEPEPGGLFGELLGVRGAVEEREVRMAVQLGVRPARRARATVGTDGSGS